MSEVAGGEMRDAEGELSCSSPAASVLNFFFVDAPAEFRAPEAIVVRIPCSVRSKEKLFSIYATALRFPDYFGWNWDAFEECLRDLSWLPINRPVAIVHEDLPFGPGGQNRGIYVEVLRGTLKSPPAATGRHVQIIMPRSLENELSPAASKPR